MIVEQKVQAEEAAYLNRREILESLVRQGISDVSKLKDACRSFERDWLKRTGEIRKRY